MVVLSAMFVVAVVFVIAGPLYGFSGLVALVLLCLLLNLLEDWAFEEPWRLRGKGDRST